MDDTIFEYVLSCDYLQNFSKQDMLMFERLLFSDVSTQSEHNMSSCDSQNLSKQDVLMIERLLFDDVSTHSKHEISSCDSQNLSDDDVSTQSEKKDNSLSNQTCVDKPLFDNFGKNKPIIDNRSFTIQDNKLCFPEFEISFLKGMHGKNSYYEVPIENFYSEQDDYFIFSGYTCIAIFPNSKYIGKKCKLMIDESKGLKNNLFFNKTETTEEKIVLAKKNGIIIRAMRSSRKKIYQLIITIDNLRYAIKIITAGRNHFFIKHK